MTLFGETCPCCGQAMPEQQETSFAEFWSVCPNKVGKSQAEKAWRKMSAANQQAAQRSISRFYEWFAKTYPQASPLHPSTYLNNKRWLDLEDEKRENLDQVIAFHRDNLNSSIPAVRLAAERALVNLQGAKQ